MPPPPPPARYAREGPLNNPIAPLLSLTAGVELLPRLSQLAPEGGQAAANLVLRQENPRRWQRFLLLLLLLLRLQLGRELVGIRGEGLGLGLLPEGSNSASSHNYQ